MDGRTDGQTNGRTYERTNGRKLARLCLPAKAGATKICVSVIYVFLIITVKKNRKLQKYFYKLRFFQRKVRKNNRRSPTQTEKSQPQGQRIFARNSGLNRRVNGECRKLGSPMHIEKSQPEDQRIMSETRVSDAYREILTRAPTDNVVNSGLRCRPMGFLGWHRRPMTDSIYSLKVEPILEMLRGPGKRQKVTNIVSF